VASRRRVGRAQAASARAPPSCARNTGGCPPWPRAFPSRYRPRCPSCARRGTGQSGSRCPLNALTHDFDRLLRAVNLGDGVRDVWDEAVSAPEWQGPPVWLHGDLHPANVVIADGTRAGVLDFGELYAGDPATESRGRVATPPLRRGHTIPHRVRRRGRRADPARATMGVTARHGPHRYRPRRANWASPAARRSGASGPVDDRPRSGVNVGRVDAFVLSSSAVLKNLQVTGHGWVFGTRSFCCPPARSS
jgi:Phosphotransferase enzyme family